MDVRPAPHLRDDRNEAQHLCELMAVLERANPGAGNRRVVIDRLRVLLAALEQASPEEDAAPIPATSPETETAEDRSSEYSAGYQAFATGEVLAGWTDTPFAQGWLAAAAQGSRQCRSGLGISSEPPL